jgi:hypothetical protein
MNEELTPPEAPRRGRRPSEVAKREKLNALINKIRENKKKVDRAKKGQ